MFGKQCLWHNGDALQMTVWKKNYWPKGVGIGKKKCMYFENLKSAGSESEWYLSMLRD